MSLLVLSACNGATVVPIEVEESSSSSIMIDDMDSSSGEATSSEATSTGSTESEAAAPAGEARIIEITVGNWAFSPSAITAKQGEKVIVRLTGSEGIHSFVIEDFGINVRIEPGQTVDVEIPTDTAGTFAFRCRIPCGEGHMDMKGSIVIS